MIDYDNKPKYHFDAFNGCSRVGILVLRHIRL